jgi:hypothetical protein
MWLATINPAKIPPPKGKKALTITAYDGTESWRPGSFSPNRLAPPAPAGGAFLCFVSPALDGL